MINVPLGQGWVGEAFFHEGRLKHFQGPITLHVEYLQQAGSEANAQALNKDLVTLRQWVKAYELDLIDFGPRAASKQKVLLWDACVALDSEPLQWALMRPMPSSNASVVRLHSPKPGVGMATVWVFALGLGWMLGGRFGSRKGWNSLSITGWCCVLLGALLGLAPQAMVQWGQDIRTSSMPLAIMMTWVALLSTMMGWVLSLFTSGNGQQANRRSAIALWFMSLAYALGQCFLLPTYGLESLVLWVSASWLLLGASGLVMKVRWGTANLSEKISESLPADQGEWGGKTSSSRYDMVAGTHDGGDSWGSHEGAAMDPWQHAFVAFGVPGSWTWRFGGRFYRIHSCETYSGRARGMALSHNRGLQLDCVLFLRGPPFWLGWVQGQFADVSEAWVLFASAVVILGDASWFLLFCAWAIWAVGMSHFIGLWSEFLIRFFYP